MGYTTEVREFTRACHDELPGKPVAMSNDAIGFIRTMVNDEMDELEQATTVTEQADALVDAIYYICDCAVRHGINLDPLFAIVHQANMTKVVDGKVVRRADGKIMKPDCWIDPGPLLEQAIAQQESGGAFTTAGGACDAGV